MRKFTQIFTHLCCAPHHQNLIKIFDGVEKSRLRFEALGFDAETTDRLMRICNKHRVSFDLDMRLAQAAASGIARPDEIAIMINAGPTAFIDPPRTYFNARLSNGILWDELLDHFDPD